MKNIIGIATVGNVDLEQINESIKEYNEGVNDLFPTYHMRHVLPRPLGIPGASYDSCTGKYSTYPFFDFGHQLFRKVAEKKHGGVSMEKCILVTNVPLYCNYSNTGVFGEAEVSGRVAVFSTHGIVTSDKSLFNSRMMKEFHFLIGALSGLTICGSTSCVMHSCHDLEGLDYKGLDLCEKCVEKLNSSDRAAGYYRWKEKKNMSKR